MKHCISISKKGTVEIFGVFFGVIGLKGRSLWEYRVFAVNIYLITTTVVR